jgi:germination protein YpeB
MIKVSIALDTGEVMGVEAGRYILNHCVRELPAPDLSPEEARKLLSSRLVLESERLAVIPNDFGGEHFVYEFSASLDGRQCLVYIDCENGREREILILQENEYGILVK